jgi:hypothetical protein
MTGSIQQSQLLALQEGLINTQRMLIEQRELNIVIAKEARRLIENAKGGNDNPIQIEDKNKNSRSIQPDEVIDAQYEIIEETKENTIVESKELETRNDILESVARQAKDDRELPLNRRATISVSENETVSAPIIFTVRNELWRSRSQYMIKEACYDGKTNSLIRINNQVNPDCAIIYLYTDKKEPEEILLIVSVTLNQYLYSDERFDSIVENNVSIDNMEHLIIFTNKKFNLNIDHYYLILEPVVNSESPYVLSKNQDKSMKADIIRITPVLSFVKSQRITFDTYYRSVIYRKLNSIN